jgi:D-tyrosyl-tRNA(Tyr) deacylase
MRVLIQRVKQGSVTVNGTLINAIGCGYVIFVGVGRDDAQADIDYLVRKTANLRVFADAEGKMNLSIKDIGCEALIISQFTLCANTAKGNRPSFEPAAVPETAQRLYQAYADGLAESGVPVKTGVFGAEMLVEIVNDGPVTILLESPQKEK